MAGPRQRRFRQLGSFFAASLGLHAWVLYSVANDTVRPFGPPLGEAQRATPVAFVPMPPPARRVPPPHAKRHAWAPLPSARIGAQTTIEARAAAPLLLTDSLGPAAPLAVPGLPAAGDVAPGDTGAPSELADAASSGRYPINPGYWEVVEHWPLINRKERYCLEPQNIFRFMAAPCNHIYHCSYPVQVFEGDRFHFQGVITGSHERFDVKGGGGYTPTSLRVSVRMQGHYKIVPVLFFASLDGQFLAADCPADAKRIRQR